MKCKAFLLMVLSLFVLSLHAQNQPDLDELIARSKITTFKSIHEVFTPQELAMLRAHYHVDDVDSNATPMGGEVAFGPESQTGHFGTFSIADPSTFDMISTSPANNFEGAGAVSDDGQEAYAIDGDNNFFSIDLITGNYTNLGKVTPPNGETFTGLEMDPTDNNKLYAVSSDGSQSSLSTIDPLTRVVTLIGVTTLVVAISLAITNAGELFTMDIDDDRLYRLNKLTAVATLIGLIGFDANFGQAMARSAFTGILFMAAFNNGVFDSELRSVNINTGLTTLIGIIVIAAVTQFGWIGIPNFNLDVPDIEQNRLVLYPNPVGDMLHIKSNKPLEGLKIYNVLGQLVYNGENQSNLNSLDISHFNSGQYVIKAQVNGDSGVYKFMKL